jgi:transposase
LSVDLRQRVLEAVAGGATHREAGRRLSVSAASVSRWKAQQQTSSDLAPRPRGGDRRSARTDQHKDAILDALGPDKDRTLAEIREILAQQKIALGASTLDRFFARHGITRKKRQPTRLSRTAPTS